MTKSMRLVIFLLSKQLCGYYTAAQIYMTFNGIFCIRWHGHCSSWML